MAFPGFGPDVVAFYDGLEAANSRDYWTAHRAVFDGQVSAPMRALAEQLEPEFGPVKLFRPNRDVRFSRDKSPYKTEAGMTVGTAAGGLYAAVSADGLFVAGGLWQAQTDQARRLRAAAADDRTGPPLTRAVAELRAAGWEVDGQRLVRVPKPWDDTHPRADLLHLKTLTGGRRHAPGAWLQHPAAADHVVDGWRELAALVHWLDRHVGPSDRPRQAAGNRAR